MRLWYVIITVTLIVTWLSHSSLDCGAYDPKPWHIVKLVWSYHGSDCVICLQDMTFVRTAGPRRGEKCRILLPEGLR